MVETFDHLAGQCGQIGGLTFGHQSQKPAQTLERQTIAPHGRKLRGECGQIGLQRLPRRTLREAERRFDRAVEPVFSGRGGDLVGRRRQVRNLYTSHRLTLKRIPAKPPRGEGPQRPLKGRIINRKSRKIFHSVQIASLCHTSVTHLWQSTGL